jgi:hypothetical protein
MLPYLPSIVVPPDVEAASEEVFGDEPCLLDALGGHVAPIARALARSPLPVTLPVVSLAGASPAARRLASRRTPLHAAHLARWARRTLVPSFCAITPSGAPLPVAVETVDVLREQLHGAVAAESVGFAGDLPTCEELLSEGSPDAADWARVLTAVLADAEAERALNWCGAEAAFGALDETRGALAAIGGDAARIVAEFIDEHVEAVSLAYDIAWLVAHHETWRVIYPALPTVGHRARAAGELRSVAAQALGEAVLPSALDLVSHTAAFVEDACGPISARGA